jgi:hypothetical protein
MVVNGLDPPIRYAMTRRPMLPLIFVGLCSKGEFLNLVKTWLNLLVVSVHLCRLQSIYLLCVMPRYPEEANSRSISVITPYNHQRTLLQERFHRTLGSTKTFTIDFNTVDGYQGREVDILIFSAVRASGQSNEGAKTVTRGNNSIGFVGDVRRMNVALTRARFSLWIVGNATTLQQNSDWAALISDAKTRQLFFPVKDPYVFKEGATAQILRVRSPSSGSYLDKSTTNEASAGTNAELIATPRSSEIGRVSVHPTEMLGREHLGLESREGIDFVNSASQPKGVAKATSQENRSSFGAQTVERDNNKQSHQAHGRRIESAIDEPRMQRSNSIPRGERNTQLRTSAPRNDDEKERISRRHPDHINSLPRPKPSDGYFLEGQERHRSKNVAMQDMSSRGRKDPRTGRSGTESRGTQKMAEGRSSEKAHTRTSADGQGHYFGSGIDRAAGPDEVRRSPSEEPRHGLPRARVSAVGTTVANQAPGASLVRARPKVAYLDFTSGHSDKSSVMKATQNIPVDGIGRDSSSEDRIERNRPSSHSGPSGSGVSPPASLLDPAGQRAGIRPDVAGSASASLDEGSRAPTGHRNRNSPLNSSNMREREWELYMRTLQEQKQTGNAVRDKSDRVQSSGSDRRQRQVGRPDSGLQTRQAGKSDSGIRTNQAGKIDVDRRTKEAAKLDADRRIERRSAQPPPNKKQKVSRIVYHCGLHDTLQQ